MGNTFGILYIDNYLTFSYNKDSTNRISIHHQIGGIYNG